MARFLYRNLSDFLRKWGKVFLAFFWISGLVLGTLFFSDMGHIFSPLMPAVLSSRMSIVGLLISVFLPLLFSAFAVYISQPALLFAVCFAKAFSVSMVSCGISAMYGGSAWIIRLLVLFHDFFACVLLLVFSMKHISTGNSLSKWEVLYYGLVGTVAAAAEYFYFGPFLADLIMF